MPMMEVGFFELEWQLQYSGETMTLEQESLRQMTFGEKNEPRLHHHAEGAEIEPLSANQTLP